MAFYAVYGKYWYKRKDIENQIILFKKYLFDQWYNHLSDTDRRAYKNALIKKKEMERRKYKMACEQFLTLMGTLDQTKDHLQANQKL